MGESISHLFCVTDRSLADILLHSLTGPVKMCSPPFHTIGRSSDVSAGRGSVAPGTLSNVNVSSSGLHPAFRILLQRGQRFCMAAT